MGLYKYVRDLWKKPRVNMPELMKERLIKWRKEPTVVRLERPTRIDKARSLGYKAKPGFIVARFHLTRGGHTRPDIKGGRRTKAQRQTLVLDKNYQQIAEERCNKKFPNCEVLNSYLVAKDGKTSWYEVILVDRDHPAIKNDSNISWISNQRGRVYRGLTSAGKKSRGLRYKGKGSEKARPSRNASYKRKAASRPKKSQYHRLD